VRSSSTFFSFSFPSRIGGDVLDIICLFCSFKPENGLNDFNFYFKRNFFSTLRFFPSCGVFEPADLASNFETYAHLSNW